MASQLAVDFGTDRVRLMEFDGTGRKLRVARVVEVDFDLPPTAPAAQEGPPEGQDAEDPRTTRLAEAVKAAGLTTDPCAMAFDGSAAIVREFNLPFTEDAQIEKVVRFESESHLPVDVDDVVLQHLVLHKTRDKSHLLVVAIKKDDLFDRLEVLEGGNLDPLFIDLSDFALFHAIVGTGVAAEHERCVVIDVRERSTTLLFIEGEELRAVRSMRLGTHGLAGGGDEAIDAARLRDTLARLQRELHRTLATLPERETSPSVLLTGSGSLLPGLPEVVREAFGVEPARLDLLERVDHRLSPEDARRFGPDIGVALGLAFKLNGLDRTGSDFRREEAAYTKKFDQLKSPLIVLSFLAFLVVCFVGLASFNNVRRLEGEYDNMLKLAQQQLMELVGDNEQAEEMWAGTDVGPDRLQAILTSMEDLRDEKAQLLGRSTTIPDLQSALAVWIDLFTLLRENENEIGRFALERLDIDLNLRTPVVKMNGEVMDATHYQKLLDLLAGRQLFSKVIPGPTKQQTDGGGLRFTDLQIELDMTALGLAGDAS